MWWNRWASPGGVLVRETPDGYMLLDGHLRTEAYPDMEVHALVTDITADEEDTVLLTYDPIVQLAVVVRGGIPVIRQHWRGLVRSVNVWRTSALSLITVRGGRAVWGFERSTF